MASISKPSRSTRRKTIPVPAGAGRIRSATWVPLWRPTPTHPTVARTVCSNGKLFQMNRLHRLFQAEVLFFYNRLWPRRNLLNRIDLGPGRVKQPRWRMVVVSNTEVDLLGNGFPVALCQDDMRSIDPLFHSPVAVNRGLLIAITISRIAGTESL